MPAGKTILLIDDDIDYRNSVRSLLEAEGYHVVEAGSGKEGLMRLVEHRPDAIVLDVMMESTDEGYGVAGAIKFEERFAEFRSIPMLMVSSIQETPEERFPMAPEVGMIAPDRYFRKPLDMDLFLETLRRLLREG
ncbi:MAG: response regulator [Gemmatimonadota bacterium]